MFAKAFHLFCELLEKYKDVAGYKLYQTGAPEKDYKKLNDEINALQREFNYSIGIGKKPNPFEQNKDLRIEIKK
jgi:iron uptake system EfeUOB component EfeO/EfeM